MSATKIITGDEISVALRVIQCGSEKVFGRRSNDLVRWHATRAPTFAVVADVPAHEYFSMGTVYRTPARTEIYLPKCYASREVAQRECDAYNALRPALRFRSGLLEEAAHA